MFYRYCIVAVCLCLPYFTQAQEDYAVDYPEPGVVVCDDGTSETSACASLDSHPALDVSGQYVSQLLQGDRKNAQKFCALSNKQCVDVMMPYFQETRSYEMRSVELVDDADLAHKAKVAFVAVMDDKKEPEVYKEYHFVFDFKPDAQNNWKITNTQVEQIKVLDTDEYETRGPVIAK
ncbi:hypothetical protein [Neisseria sp. Ec49-e6-T10]|uniref:hypothetical protein n=1 Tax=Neisseria sp. Ec49-e6-T10 TaxID=3140744 RepID=UPI003EBF43EC